MTNEAAFCPGLLLDVHHFRRVPGPLLDSRTYAAAQHPMPCLQEVEPGETPAVLGAAAVPAYRVDIFTGRAAVEAAQLVPGNGSGADVHNPFLARVAAARELHGPRSERSCLHVELDISGSKVGHCWSRV